MFFCVYLCTVVKRSNGIRRRSVVLQTARRRHHVVVALHKADLDLPLAIDAIPLVGDYREDHRIRRPSAHVHVHVLALVLAAEHWQPLTDCGSHHEAVLGATTELIGLGEFKLKSNKILKFNKR